MQQSREPTLSANERHILATIRQRGPMARADLAKSLGLSAQAVTNITRGLIAAGLLDDGEPVRGKVGQPSRPLRLVPAGAYFLGLKVGRRSAEMLLVDFAGEVVAERILPYPHPTPEAVVAFARQTAAAFCAQVPSAACAGLGVALPFYLWDWGVAMQGWRDFDLQAALEQATALPVWVENDASCACGAELLRNPDLPDDFLHLYLGHFAGGGLVLGGRLHFGPGRNAGAMGSAPVPVSGGRAAQLLDIASISVLENRAGQAMPPECADWPVPWHLRMNWIVDAAQAMAWASLSAVAVADLRMVVIDGALPPDWRRELVAATATALGRLPSAGLELPQVREGGLGRRARALGAAALPLTALFGLQPATQLPRTTRP